MDVRVDRLSQQDCDGHGPDPAGDRCDQAGGGAGRVDVDVADVAGVVSGVDHDGPRLDVFAANKPRPSHGRHNNVRFPHGRGQISPTGVAVGDRGVPGEQEHSDGLAEDRASTHDNGMLTCKIDVVLVREPHDPARGARCETRQPEAHRPEGAHRDFVDVLFRRDGLERRPLIDVRAYGVLKQDAVHVGVP
jgi:hypothetical protein